MHSKWRRNPPPPPPPKKKKKKKKNYIYICHGRKSNLVEFEILPVESPIGVSTNINLVESPVGVSTGREMVMEFDNDCKILKID